MDPVPSPETRAMITAIRADRLLDYLTGRRMLVLPAGAKLTGFWRDDLVRHGAVIKTRIRFENRA